jgi:DNA-binding transcriptional ArsR family regulator
VSAEQQLEQLRATAHPSRLRMLSLLTGAAMSAAEVARELDVTQANASYHLRLLERAGLVHVVEELKVRGGVARRYRHESSSESFAAEEAPVGGAGLQDARLHFIALLAEAMRERSTRRVAGPSVNTDAELWVAPDVWRQVVDMVGEASALLHSSAQPPRAEGTVPVAMTTALFRVADERAESMGTAAKPTTISEPSDDH